jgi:hypothetical protein
VPVGSGLSLAWAPAPELGGIATVWFLADRHDIGFSALLTRPGLQALIRDLKSIDEQLGRQS